MTSKQFCTSCGTAIPENAAFCPGCGKRIEKKSANICSQCGAELIEGMLFCSNCGNRIVPSEPQEYKAPVEEPVKEEDNSDVTVCIMPEDNADEEISENEPSSEIPEEATVSETYGETVTSAAPAYEAPVSEPVYAGPAYTPYAPQTSNVRPNAKRFSVKELIKSAALCIISVLLVISFFTPIFTITVDTDDLEDAFEDYEDYYEDYTEAIDKYAIKISPLESIVFFFNSLENMSMEDVYESDLYEELQENLEDIDIEDFEDYSASNNATINKLAKKAAKLALKTEMIKATPSAIATFAVSVIYAVLTVALLGASVVSLLNTLGGSSCSKAAISILCLVTALFPVYVMINKAFGITGSLITLIKDAIDAEFDSFVDFNVSAFPVIIAVISLIFIIACALIRVVTEKERIRVAAIVKRTISVALCIFLIFAGTMPVLTVTFTGEFGESEKERSASTSISPIYFCNVPNVVNGFEFSYDSVLEYYDEYDFYREQYIDYVGEDGELDFFEWLDKEITDESELILRWTEVRDIRKGKEDVSVFRYVLMNAYRYNDAVSFAYGFLPVAYIVALVLAALIIWFNYNAVANGKRSNVGSIFFKLFGAIFAAVALGILILFMIMACQNEPISELSFELAPAYGVIVFTVTAVAIACVPLNTKKKNKPTTSEYIPYGTQQW